MAAEEIEITPPAQEKKPVVSLQDRARALTEHKSDSANLNGSGGTGGGEPIPPKEKSFNGKASSAFWSQDPPAPEQNTNTNTNNQGTGTQQPATENKVTYTRARAIAAADITTMGIDNLQRFLFTVLENIRHKRKFKPHEIKRINDANLVDYLKFSELPADLQASDQSLWRKWNNLQKRHDKKIGRIPMTDPEKRNWNEMLMAYQEYKQEILSPAWGIAIAALNLVASRAQEIYMED